MGKCVVKGSNPIIGMDYPDVDVIRVEDTYYMVSTTMYFMPGCVILRSYDLINWEIASYVYETLDDTDRQKLEGEKNIYGKGMWAANIRYHKGTFYICFVANDTHKTYLYQSKSIEGPWKKQTIEGFYHDCSLLFDEDDKVYLIYGNKTIHLTQLNADLTGPQPGGLDRIIVEDKDHPSLGYEGSHFYKINGRYYAFFIHSLRDRWFRTEACFSSDSLTGEFTGGDVVQDDINHRGSGVAQGGIVDTPDGKWYGILFQDRGAVGRIPVLIPMHWEDGFPVFGENGKIPMQIETTSTRPDYCYKPLYISDDFDYRPDEKGEIHLNPVWQWNHNPHHELWTVKDKALCLKSGKVCSNLLQSYNMLTQRTAEWVSSAEVELDGSQMKVGDYAGICTLLGYYGAVGLKRTKQGFEMVMMGKAPNDGEMMPKEDTTKVPADEYQTMVIQESKVTVKVVVDFHDGVDEAAFYYKKGDKWQTVGIMQKLYFKLDLFTGCRFGLFYFSTKEAGGEVRFKAFKYERIE